jgi:Ca-activated chloride channel family protein
MRSRLPAAGIVVMLLAGERAPGQLLAARQASGQPAATFSSESQVVVLHVAVRDKKGYVSGLEKGAFHVFENKQPQPISFFSNQDAPVTVGLVIDSSGSMGNNRDRVIAAAVAFAETSNPQDEIFVLGFNENITIPLPADAPFTHDIPTLRSALYKAIAARGQSAVYDAVNAGLKYLDRGNYERKVLVLVSDGGDNASTATRAQVLANAEASNSVIYTVGVIDPMETEANPGFLRQLSDASGGEMFEPHNVAEVNSVLQQVAHDIRNMYTLGYSPGATATSAKSGKKQELRSVSVSVTLPTGRKAMVRTRRAYLAGREPERSASDDSAGR